MIKNFEVKINISELNDVRININNKNSKIWQSDYDVIIIWSDLSKVSSEYRKAIYLEKFSRTKLMKDISSFVQSIKEISGATNYLIFNNWIQNTDYKGYGFFDLKYNLGTRNLLEQLNIKVSKLVYKSNNIIQYDLNNLFAKTDKNIFNEKSYYLTKVPFTNDAFKNFASDVNLFINHLYGYGIKLIILDLDDTIWGGIVGDIGWENLLVGGHSSVGESFRDFQNFLKNLSKKGISLAIVSKNNQDIAINAINSNPEMVLSMKDFVSWRINWKKKSENILEILNELNLPSSSAIFIDDSKFEREEVKNSISGILVPELPVDKRLYRNFISSLNLFHFDNVTKEDKERTLYYKNEQKRVKLKNKYQDHDDWLDSLNIRINIEKINNSNLERTHQLFNKTNQMNLTTRRLSKEKILENSKNKKNIFRVFSVFDNYGEYGLTGILSLYSENDNIVLKDFILSCRVFGRDIEGSMLNTALLICKNLGYDKLQAFYLPTERNVVCKDFLKRSFNSIRDNKFEIKTNSATLKFKNFEIIDNI